MQSELVNGGYELAEVVLYDSVIDVPGFAEDRQWAYIEEVGLGDHGWLCLDELVLPECRGPGRAHGPS